MKDHREATGWNDATSAAQNGDIRVLFVEDVPDEVELAVHQLQQNGIGCVHQRVETEPQLREALRDFRPEIECLLRAIDDDDLIDIA